MKAEGKHILITGLPGVGKTTLIRRIAEEFKDDHPAGFYTEEIRENGTRKGFELVSLDGAKAVLSHVNMKSKKKVGKYGVDVHDFEDFLDRLDLVRPEPSLVIIDEIGKMECFSEMFIDIIGNVLDSGNTLIATVALKGSGMMSDIKKRDDVYVFKVTRENRDHLLSEIIKYVRDHLKRRG